MWMLSAIPLPIAPVAALEPFRIANRYGLFGILTRGRYEIEFQGECWGDHGDFRLQRTPRNLDNAVFAA
jgi:hypothetical protein